MIDKGVKRDNCVGCEACIQACPRRAISLSIDDEGFASPQVDYNICIDCGLCLQKCQVLNPKAEREPICVYWAYHRDDVIKEASSSGGLFSTFAEHFIDLGGYVCGAAFDANWSVEHCVVSHASELENLKKSKYVQSRIGTCYREILDLLCKNNKVLFCGTPCEVAGLLSFIGKEYDNLTTIEIVCHGSPSPWVWSNYLNTISNPVDITSINFRDKSRGWSEYSVVVKGNNDKILLNESRYDNIYIQGFLKNLYLRPSCYNCQNKNFRSGADLTIGDFWGVGHTAIKHDGKGISLCYINTDKGSNLFQNIKNRIICGELSSADIIQARVFKGAVSSSAKLPKVRNQFWQEYKLAKGYDKNLVIRKYARDAFSVRLKRRIRKLIPSFVVKLIKKVK